MKTYLSIIVIGAFISINLYARPALKCANVIQPHSNTLVYIFAGQSNMHGFAKTTNLPKEMVQLPKNVTFYFGEYNGEENQIAKMKSFDGQRLGDDHNFGPEVSFAHSVAKEFPDKKIIIIKYAVPGTSLLDWSPYWKMQRKMNPNEPITHKLFGKLMTKIAQVEKLEGGKPLPYEAMFWMQGEADAALSIENYYNHLQSFIGNMRDKTQNHDLLFIFGRIFNYKDLKEIFPKQESIEAVRNDQSKVAQNVELTKVVNVDDCTLLPDRLHFDEKCQRLLGERFAQAYFDLKCEQTHPKTNGSEASGVK